MEEGEGGEGELQVAVKVHKGEGMAKEKIAALCREARLMRDYEHPNIVNFYGVAVEKVEEREEGEEVEGAHHARHGIRREGRPRLLSPEAWRVHQHR